MHPQTRRRILIIAVAVVVTAALIYGFMPKPLPVDIADAVRAPMRVTIDEEGKARVKDRFMVSAPVAGFLRRVALKVGDAVKKGQVIAELEPLRSGALDPRSRAEALAAVSSAQASVNAAKENSLAAEVSAEYAKRNFDRLKKLFDAGYISRDALEQADADAKRTDAVRLAAEARVRASRSELDRSRSLLGHSMAEGAVDRERVVALRAQADGRVLRIHHESEGVISSGEPILDIGEPSILEVRAEVLSADAVNIKTGMPAIFERWGGQEPLSGIVKVVEPAAFTKVSSLGVEEQRVLVIADITSVPEAWRRLGDGYRVEASFVVWENRDVLQIPASALFRKGDKWAVFAIESSRARLKEVTIGHRNSLTAEITSGLTNKDKVITHPDDLIQDGSRVRQRKTGR